MFGVSFLEITLVGLVALIVVGPQKLPEMMRTAGEWVGKLRRITADMRTQTGIDDILREEGIDGVRELRTLLRGERGVAARRSMRNNYDAEISPPDLAVEFPMEGPDSHGALPDDLLQEEEAAATVGPETTPSTNVSPPSPSPPQTSSTPSLPSASPPPPRPSRPPPRPSQSPPSPSHAPASSSLPPPRPGSARPPRSLPPPPTTPRISPPRAVTHPETPASKSEPKITISEPPPVRSPKAPGKSS